MNEQRGESKMNEFNTLENIAELFKKVNCIGEENCFFYSTRNMQTKGVVLGGLAGALKEGMEAKANNRAWDGYLINQTEKGIGLIPLKNTKVLSLSSIKPENMIVQLDEFIFVEKDNISNIKIKKFNLFSPIAKTVYIKLKNDADFNLFVNNKEKQLPYHEENFSKFVSKNQHT